MPHGKPRDLDKERLWAARIQLWHKSGLSARLFCLRRNLSLPSFHAWRRTLKLRHKPAPATPDQPAFLPVHVRQVAQSPHFLGLILSSGYRLIIPQGYDVNHLADILDTLEEQPCWASPTFRIFLHAQPADLRKCSERASSPHELPGELEPPDPHGRFLTPRFCLPIATPFAAFFTTLASSEPISCPDQHCSS